jgi:hypothetical protein
MRSCEKAAAINVRAAMLTAGAEFDLKEPAATAAIRIGFRRSRPSSCSASAEIGAEA